MTRDENELRTPPGYCEYADGACDQDFTTQRPITGLFLYPSEPSEIASAIEEAVVKLRVARPNDWWVRWRDLDVAGQVIFCTICKAMRFSKAIYVDVTTLNFNLLFEIGFALGLGVAVIPIRDTSFIRDSRQFEQLGLLDTIGYRDFQNAAELRDAVLATQNSPSLPAPPATLDRGAPLYVLKGPIATEGEVRLFSALKKSSVQFRTFDAVESPRLSLHELRRRVGAAYGVVAPLLGPNRRGATTHNGLCAVASGMAMASEKACLMLQEGRVIQPIDYRDVVHDYSCPEEVPRRVERVVIKIIKWLQMTSTPIPPPPEGFLERLDIGDVAAENEIRPLRSYFVKTGQFLEAKRGHARLVVGRKGSGKTAVFYSIRDSVGGGHSRLVLDLKPEGHQFTRLREVVLSKMSVGMQEHTLAGFWNAILLAELAHKITDYDYSWAQRDEGRRQRFERVGELYERCGFAEEGDFSERLLNQVNQLAARFEGVPGDLSDSQLTQALFSMEIPAFSDAIGDYLVDKDEVWLLIDNLDKGWPTRGATQDDILIVRTLLEATRKLQRQMEKRDVDFHCLVFLRNDIYDHLVAETPDKGKDTEVTLDWSDPELFKRMMESRLRASGAKGSTFEQLWHQVFESHVGTVTSFDYILARTLMRPRDFLSFVHRAVEVAINHSHQVVTEDDLRFAEEIYSGDMLQMTSYELQDVRPWIHDFLYSMLGCSTTPSEQELRAAIVSAGVDEDDVGEVLEFLAWFGVLGVKLVDEERETYAHEMRYDMAKLLSPLRSGRGQLVVHPAFRTALECPE